MKRKRFYEISREKKENKNVTLRQNTRNAYEVFTYQPNHRMDAAFRGSSHLQFRALRAQELCATVRNWKDFVSQKHSREWPFYKI